MLFTTEAQLEAATDRTWIAGPGLKSYLIGGTVYSVDTLVEDDGSVDQIITERPATTQDYIDGDVLRPLSIAMESPDFDWEGGILSRQESID